MRDLCRMFAAAGEAYCTLIVGNLEAWKGIVEGLLSCAEQDDLSIVSITFMFWSMLAEAIIGHPSREQFAYIYQRLMEGMIKHLHYPNNESTWTGKERDEFREFRHQVGDVLKDCVVVLGAEAALGKVLHLLNGFVVSGSPTGTLDASIPWQKVEAPLFALRTMGEKISDSESTVMPRIMGMLPQLPPHPKVKYSAILLIGRYATWTRLHPEFLPYQMTYVSHGFEEKESIAAASRALKYLCNECGERIVDYLGQLHPFYLNILNQLESWEKKDLSEALAHVIKHVPVVTPDGGPPNLAKVLEMFCLPMAQRLHEIISLGQAEKENKTGNFKALSKEAAVAQFNIFLDYVEIDEDLRENHPCVLLFNNMWPILSALLDLNDITITSAVCKPLQLVARRYHPSIRSFLPEVIPKLASAYAADPNSTGLLWVASIYVRYFGDERRGEGTAMYQLVESMSQGAFGVVQQNSSNLKQIPEIVEDYFLLLSSFVEQCPTLFVQSPLLPSFIKCAIVCMDVHDLNAWLSLYCKFFRGVFKLASPIWRDRRLSRISAHSSNAAAAAAAAVTNTPLPSTPNAGAVPPPATPSTSPARPSTPPMVPPPAQELVEPLTAVLRSEAVDFLKGILLGIMNTFPPSEQLQCTDGYDRILERSMREDEELLGKGASLYFVGTVVLLFFDVLGPAEGLQALGAAINALPPATISMEERQAALSKIASQVEARSARNLERNLTRFAILYEKRILKTLAK
ncbi:Nuclear import receptor [Phlyctochytrium bullatum]|nr:Nuclear import receptor [Phlyctochytrium bullatum]